MNFDWSLVINDVLEFFYILAESLSSCPINCFERSIKIFNVNQIWTSLFLLSVLSNFALRIFHLYCWVHTHINF